MQWNRLDFAACSRCRSFALLLNEHGICGGCWGNLSNDERLAMTGTDARVVYTLPAQQGFFRRIIAGWIGGATGAGTALFVARLMHWI